MADPIRNLYDYFPAAARRHVEDESSGILDASKNEQTEEEAIDLFHECLPLMHLVRPESAHVEMEAQCKLSRAAYLQDGPLQLLRDGFKRESLRDAEHAYGAGLVFLRPLQDTFPDPMGLAAP